MSYTKHTWVTGETITAANLNHLEQGVYDATEIGTGAVTTAKIADGAVTDAKLAQSGGVLDKVNIINNGYYAFDLVVNTYILRDNGNEASYSGWSATDFIPVPPYHRIKIDTNGASLTWGAKYDSSKTYVEAATWNTQFVERYNDSNSFVYYRTSGSNADMQGVKITVYATTDKTLAKEGIPADAKTTGDQLTAFNNRISEVVFTVPSYYETHLSSKEATIRGKEKDCSINGDAFIFLTDTHFDSNAFTASTPSTTYNTNHSLALVKDVLSKTGTRMIVCGGDLMNSAPDIDTMIYSICAFESKFLNYKDRIRYCAGNHEYYTGNDLGETVKPTSEWLYGAGVKYNENEIGDVSSTGAYWFDNKTEKIRYFIVPCDRETVIPVAEVEWVLNEFKSIPEGYKVILIGHAFIKDSMDGFRGRHQYIADAFDKVKSKSSISYNGTTYNYSSLVDVTPVCIISGHTHIDGSITTTGGIPVISTTCDSYKLNYENVGGTLTNVPRSTGTTDEQAFDVIQFDFAEKKIYCTRIGYGSDRVFSY